MSGPAIVVLLGLLLVIAAGALFLVQRKWPTALRDLFTDKETK